MKFTLSQAAKEAGVSKSTVSKAVSNGRLSAVRLDDGSFQIEAVELFRVFPARTAERGPEPFANPSKLLENASGSQSSPLIQLQAEMLDELLRREREERAREREERERERDAWNRERETVLERERVTTEDLRKRLDRAEERVLALSAPAAQERPSVPSAPVEPLRGLSGLLSRLWGR